MLLGRKVVRLGNLGLSRILPTETQLNDEVFQSFLPLYIYSLLISLQLELLDLAMSFSQKFEEARVWKELLHFPGYSKKRHKKFIVQKDRTAIYCQYIENQR